MVLPRVVRASFLMPASFGVEELQPTEALEGKGRTNLILLISRVVTYPASHGSTGPFSLLVSWFYIGRCRQNSGGEFKAKS